MVSTGNGELGFDSGEGAGGTAPTSKEGSRRANYPIPTRGGSKLIPPPIHARERVLTPSPPL